MYISATIHVMSYYQETYQAGLKEMGKELQERTGRIRELQGEYEKKKSMEEVEGNYEPQKRIKVSERMSLERQSVEEEHQENTDGQECSKYLA